MKMLKALIATAILGTSTLAVAQPMLRDHRDHSDTTYYTPNGGGYERDRDVAQRFRQRRGPVMLAQNLALDRRHPAFVQLDGRVSQIRFDADDRSQPLTLNVDGRVTGVYIYGMSRRGSLDVVGIRGASGYSRWNESRW